MARALSRYPTLAEHSKNRIRPIVNLAYKNILIFRVGHLGDTVVAIPAFWAIRKAFPNARLTLLTNRDFKNPHYISPLDVLPRNGIIDDCIEYPSERGLVGRSVELLKLSLRLRRRKFDAVIYLLPRIRSDVQIRRDIKTFSIAGIEKILGIRYFRENKLSYVIPKPTPVVETEAAFLLNILSNEGLLPEDFQPSTDLLLTSDEISEARKVLAQQDGNLHNGKKLLAVAPGSKWESKVWDEIYYFEVVNRLIQRERCYPIIFGGSEDRNKGERLLKQWKTGSNLAGLLNVRESAAMLMDCALYLGNDTGTMHLAGAVGTPCVAIFAAIDYRDRFMPFGVKNTVFRKSVECEGCVTPDCFNDHKCLKLVTIDEVYDACVRTLATA